MTRQKLHKLIVSALRKTKEQGRDLAFARCRKIDEYLTEQESKNN